MPVEVDVFAAENSNRLNGRDTGQLHLAKYCIMQPYSV